MEWILDKMDTILQATYSDAFYWIKTITFLTHFHWSLSLRVQLTHCGLVTPFGTRDLGQHWFSQWLVAWRHQAITWTNVDLSSLRSHDVNLMAISLEISLPSVTKIGLKIIFLKNLLKSPRGQWVKVTARYRAFNDPSPEPMMNQFTGNLYVS